MAGLVPAIHAVALTTNAEDNTATARGSVPAKQFALRRLSRVDGRDKPGQARP